MPKLSERLFITRVDAKQEIMRERQLNQRERENILSPKVDEPKCMGLILNNFN